MKFMPSFILVVLLFMCGSTMAADPQVQNATEARPGQETPSPVLDINKAELENGVILDRDAASKSLQTEPSLSPMMVEIKAALEANRNQVQELTTRAASAPDFRAQRALHQEAAQLKQQVELDILAIQARYAREGGNEELAQRIENAIEMILNPPTPEAPTETRPAPLNR